jgi:hypothetical protein
LAIYIAACGFEEASDSAHSHELDAKTRVAPKFLSDPSKVDTDKSVVSGVVTVVKENRSNSVSSLPSANSDGSSANVPSWMPVHSFSFTVAQLPVLNLVRDDLTLQDLSDIKHIADGSNANVFLCTFQGEKVSFF